MGAASETRKGTSVRAAGRAPGLWSGAWAVWKKESRTFFYSPQAYVILGGFVLLTQYVFFRMFWLRGEADIRPLFDNLPLIFLVFTPLITMKMWAEERATGTQETLFSLPVTPTAMILGKLGAGLTIVIAALLLTFPLPLIASHLGDLDWGPVWGGYIAAILLGTAYISIGLFLSSLTRTQIEAAFLTLFVAGILYFVGEPIITTRITDSGLYDFMLRIGLGSRFRNIARGVLDIRDLAYYLSVTLVFVILNVAVLRHRKWL